MKSTPILISLSLPPSKKPRTDGVHLSAIIRCIAQETGILKPEWCEDLSLLDLREITDPVAILRISIGLAWEEWYIPNHLAKAFGVSDHPGELCIDSIYMTPDGESLDVVITQRDRKGHVIRIHEVKATYKSTNTIGDDPDDPLYMMQIKGYCKGADTRHAALHILFLCGDYKFPIQPQLKCWNLEFTQEEIDDNWSLMTEYRDHRMKMEKKS
jgi:hypothetical protein